MCHVLVIEDEPLIACLISDIAMDAGATSVDIADTPVYALALARPPAVILLDVQIIDGTGPETVSEIRPHLGPTPVIFITATPEACISCEYAAAILQKPVMAHRVRNIFRQIAPI
ncbi:response regulator [Sphingomonas sp. STIS6.2]|uniref:response regulator n=1 Tax=Sphingomonas sp. STIS6.2 TaxID=1379700 RepID=UPI0004DB60FC|nr:response regulator [Sphingomonas sp. STIS6.2]